MKPVKRITRKAFAKYRKLLAIFVLILGFVYIAGAEGSSEQKATVILNTDHETGTVNKLIFGNNQIGYQYGAWQWANPEYADRGSGIWDPDKKQPVPEMIQLADDIGMSVARWPGGCGSHNFNWKKTIGPLNERPNQKFGLPEFLTFCAAINAIPVITIAEYYGTARDAADLVEYLNAPDDGSHPWAAKRSADGHQKPWNVIWFEFGNESDHGNHGGAEFPGEFSIYSPEKYAMRYLEYRELMRVVDDKVKLGVVMTPGVYQTNLTEWDKEILKAIGSNLDFVIPHPYIPMYGSNDGIPDANTLFSIGLAAPNQVSMYFRQLNAQIRQSTGKTDVLLANTEFNGSFVQEKPVPYRLCLGTALIVADLLRVFMQPENKVALANYWQFANEYWGMIKGYEPPYVFRPAYWVYWLYAHHFGDVLIEARVKCGSYDTAGGYGVMPASGNPVEFKFFPEDLLPEQKWVMYKVDGVIQSEENGILTVEIQTKEDLNYYHAGKQMRAEPSTGYRVTAEMKTEGFEKSRGAQIQVGDARGWSVTESASLSESVISTEWVKVSVDYITLWDTRAVSILARRLEGQGSKGKIFIRNLKVQKIIPENPGAVPYLSINASKSADNKKIYVIIVNKHLSESIKTLIRIQGAKKAKAWCLNGPGIDAVNEINPDNVRVNELPVSTMTNAVEIFLPQHSMTAIEIDKR